MELLGFLNRYHEFPAPLTAVVRDGRDMKVILPNAAVIPVRPESVEKIRQLEDYVELPSTLKGDPMTHAYFALDEKDVRELPRDGLAFHLRELIDSLKDFGKREVLYDYLDDIERADLRQRRKGAAASTPPAPPAP